MARIVCQIGCVKNAKKKQSVRAFINDIEVSWKDDVDGIWLTSLKDKVWRGETWYLCELDLDEGDILRLDVKTFLMGVGLDEEETFEVFYTASDDNAVKEMNRRGVGMKSYPLVKGRMVEMGFVTQEDKRKADIEEFINEGF